jgi:UDP-N-acetylmuramate-alanine ligase
VYVDFAHTPDALRNVLMSLRPHVRRGSRLHVLFGCGGDRDTTKRPVMGRIASELADVVFITDDNPRTESPIEIRNAILAAAPGARDAGERRNAIATALSELESGDVLLVAGQGARGLPDSSGPGEAGENSWPGQTGRYSRTKFPFQTRKSCVSLRGPWTLRARRRMF